MKILLVWDVAGVACVQAKYLRKLGHECKVLMRASHDGFGFCNFYNEAVYDMDGPEFDNFAIMRAEPYDVIHVNSDFRLAFRIKRQYPSKVVVLQYHGSDVRLTPYEDRQMYERVLDNILISTPDLNDYSRDRVYEWLPLMIDRDHFKPSKHARGALFIKTKDQLMPPTNTPYNIHVVFRDLTPWSYKEMPILFKKYSTYVDIRYDKDVGLVTALSKTALEALSTGMEVYTCDGRIIKELPECFKDGNVAFKLEREYKQL